MPWTINHRFGSDLFAGCVVLGAGIAVISPEWRSRMKKQLSGRIGNLRSKH
jgi:hypothetical protein